jgi:pimeloyl-ACP methyl ester carboxylesterase
VLAPDLRGFGGSDSVPPGGYYHFPDYVADVALLVDRLAPERLAVVGHSMGGTVSCLYTGAHPDRVERLALLEGIGPLAAEPALAIDRMNAWLRDLRKGSWTHKPLASMEDAVDRLAANHPRIPRDVIASRARLLVRTDAEGRMTWAYDALHRTRTPTPFNNDTFRAFLANISCPALFVGGGTTGWHPPDEAERIACLRNVVTFEIPDAGHMLHWSAPDALAGRLLEHFR